MGKIIITLLILFTVNSQINAAGKHPPLLTPEQEVSYADYLEGEINAKKSFAFPYVHWDECYDFVTGAYVGNNCNRRRMSSEILHEFLQSFFTSCALQAGRAINISANKVHIIHKGIYADKRHTPESLHSEGRAIDIAGVVLVGRRQNYIPFEKYGYGKFYRTLRQCWGRTLSRYNSCPLFDNKTVLTGSLGKEDEDHQKHLHLSVPYCYNSRHLGHYFRR